jgi:GDP-L-fucose synthase
VVLWGTGEPRREFLHVDDLARACLFLIQKDVARYELVNVGCGSDLSIAELAALIAEVVGYRGEVAFDRTKPDGTPRKLLDVTRLQGLGWSPAIGLRQGIQDTYVWYRRRVAEA